MIAAAALLAVQSFASTPEGAALSVVYSDRAPVVRRVNVVGSYATVLISGGTMESSPVTAPILVKRFSFGWQPLDVLNDRCVLISQALDAQIETKLMLGMPRLSGKSDCRRRSKDDGPQDDVDRVRQLMRGPLVPSVIVVGTWALGQWYGAGGGEDLFQMRERRWKLVMGGGGALGVHEMREYGVPQTDWCAFRIYDASCP